MIIHNSEQYYKPFTFLETKCTEEKETFQKMEKLWMTAA